MTAHLRLDPIRLARLRLERGWSQVDLWERSGIHYVTIARIESGKQQARPVTIRTLANVFGISITELAEVYEDAPAGGVA